MATQLVIDDRLLRQWVLSDESLYLRAREYGGGGDDAMYEKLPAFIARHRANLAAYVRERLSTNKN